MRVAILDDWHDTLKTLPCFSKLKPFDVTIFNDHVEDVDVLAERLAGMDAVVLIRERTHIRRALVDRLPHLRLISQRSVWPHIDVEACTENGVMVGEPAGGVSASRDLGSTLACQQQYDGAIRTPCCSHLPVDLTSSGAPCTCWPAAGVFEHARRHALVRDRRADLGAAALGRASHPAADGVAEGWQLAARTRHDAQGPQARGVRVGCGSCPCWGVLRSSSRPR